VLGYPFFIFSIHLTSTRVVTYRSHVAGTASRICEVDPRPHSRQVSGKSHAHDPNLY
jgi:hypothetical protein